MPDQPRSAAPIVVAVLVVLGMPALYVLSTGPAVLLMERGYLNPEWVDWVYQPIEWAMDTWPWFHTALSWYLDLFV